MPRYEHDCKECTFIGEDGPRGPKEGKNYVDVYYHSGWRQGIGFLTRRWGSGKYDKEEKSIQKAHEAMSNMGVEHDRWAAVMIFAKKKGIVL